MRSLDGTLDRLASWSLKHPQITQLVFMGGAALLGYMIGRKTK